MMFGHAVDLIKALTPARATGALAGELPGTPTPAPRVPPPPRTPPPSAPKRIEDRELDLLSSPPAAPEDIPRFLAHAKTKGVTVGNELAAELETRKLGPKIIARDIPADKIMTMAILDAGFAEGDAYKLKHQAKIFACQEKRKYQEDKALEKDQGRRPSRKLQIFTHRVCTDRTSIPTGS
jgi:hypothetical protein